ncbi:futsch [Drosophila simulans]|uniref:Futsch n=1 Tax=Drosophila simulans TaxID=7240 RepID=B4R2P4_DROSI|nr:futsch [Drosophila simulans]
MSDEGGQKPHHSPHLRRHHHRHYRGALRVVAKVAGKVAPTRGNCASGDAALEAVETIKLDNSNPLDTPCVLESMSVPGSPGIAYISGSTSDPSAIRERLIQYASENLVTEVLIHPQYNTLIQCMRNLLSSFTRHRHIIHAGYTFSGNGSWILHVDTEASRPESVVDSVKDEAEKQESPQYIKDDKSTEHSRRESLADKSAVPSEKFVSRPVSVASDHEAAEAIEDDAKSSISPKDKSRPGSVAETVSSPIEEAPIEFSKIEVVEKSNLALSLQAGSGGKLQTDSSPVDVAEGDFSHVVASVSTVTPTLTKPAELAKIGAAITVSSPVDEAPRTPSAPEHISRADSPAEYASEEIASQDKSPQVSKESSRPASVTESKDDAAQLKRSVEDLRSPVASTEISRPASVGETASSPIEEAPKDFAEFEQSVKAMLPLTIELKGSLPTLSSPVDVAHGDFPPTSTTSSPTAAAVQPAELSKVDIEKTASSPIDEAPKSVLGSPAEERPESPAESAKDAAESVEKSKDASRPPSVVESTKADSTKGDISPSPESVLEGPKDDVEKSRESSRPPSVSASITGDSTKDVSRPASVVESVRDEHDKAESRRDTSSATKDDSLKETVAEFLATEKIVSAKEAFSTEATKSADDCLKKATASTVSSTTASQRALFVGTDESRRESLLSQASESRLTHSDPEDEEPADDVDERSSVKESRSKSIATIMMTSIYKPSEDMEPISKLVEEEHEHVEELTQEVTSTSKTTTLLQSSEQSSSTTTSSTTKTGASRVESITLTQMDQQTSQSQAEPADRKTPPTAPVSPGVKAMSSTGSAGSVIGAGAVAAGGKCESSAASIVSSSGPMSPKDISGKSSPGALTSESQSIPTPLGRESHTDTP